MFAVFTVSTVVTMFAGFTVFTGFTVVTMFAGFTVFTGFTGFTGFTEFTEFTEFQRRGSSVRRLFGAVGRGSCRCCCCCCRYTSQWLFHRGCRSAPTSALVGGGALISGACGDW